MLRTRKNRPECRSKEMFVRARGDAMPYRDEERFASFVTFAQFAF